MIQLIQIRDKYYVRKRGIIFWKYYRPVEGDWVTWVTISEHLDGESDRDTAIARFDMQVAKRNINKTKKILMVG